MSLPALLAYTPEASPPYLRAEPRAVGAWRDRLAGGSRINVGIAWAGNATHGNDHNRSAPLATFRALAAEGCRYVTVQPVQRDGDRAALAGWGDAVDFGGELRDFGDTAALVEALDLVVAVDTAVAHLAGALGKPVWILLPHAPDWRWMLDRRDSPWYPTARLYRQPAAGDWASVMAGVHRDLAALAQERNRP